MKTSPPLPRSFSGLLTVVLSFIFAAPSVFGAVIVFGFADGAEVIAGHSGGASANAYVTNFDGEPRIRGNSINDLAKGYVRFDISALPAGAVVTSATFSIWTSAAAGSTDVNLFGIKDGVANEAFTGSTITYDNAPGNLDYNGATTNFLANNIGMNSAEVVSLATGGTYIQSTIQANRRVFSVTFTGDALLSFINGDTNNTVTFALTPDEGMGAQGFFTTNNAETGLALTYVPEPSAAVMLLGGAGMMVFLRRTRRFRK